VRFRLVGEGQLEDALGDRPANVEWVRWIEYERLGDEYRRAACALGIYGTSSKARRVIPNKAYQALACGTPLVTADTPAARELLRDGDSALLVHAGGADALAGAVRRVLEDDALGQGLSARGHAAFRQHASDDVLAERWRAIVAAVAR
jgi:glycosyltransferase involved in cell wall biosynthesis